MASETVELIFRIRAEGQQTIDAIKAAVAGNTKEVNLAAKAVGDFDKANASLTVTLKNEVKASDDAASSHRKNADSMTGTIVKSVLLSEAIGKVIEVLKTATIESSQYAARTEQTGVVMDQLARVNGLSVNAVRAQSMAVRDLGITTQESRETINKMIFAQLDLTKATDLARLSQNAAKIAGISSSEALAGIIAGIVEQRVQMLRTYGIQVSFEQALARGAAALGKTRDTLSDYERSNIALNEVLSKGPRILGAYEVSLQTTAGQMQSLKRYSDEAKNALGEEFAASLQRVVEGLTGASKNVRDHAETWHDLATAVTSAGFAIAAAKLTPGGPVAKGIVGGAVFLGSEALGNVDPAVAAEDAARAALENIANQKQMLARKAQKGLLKDQAEYTTELERLNKMEEIATEQLLEKLGAIWTRKQAEAKSQSGYSLFKRAMDPRNFFDSAYDTAAPPVPQPGNVDLGSGRRLTAEQIKAAMNQKPITDVDLAGLKFTPPDGDEAMVASFNTRIKEAMKTAMAGLARAKAGLLTGDSKVETERSAALERVSKEFEPFSERLKTGGDYAKLLGVINNEYDILLQKEHRDKAISDIKNQRSIQDAVASGGLTISKAKSASASRIALAGKGSDEQAPQEAYKEQIDLAKEDYKISLDRAQADLAAAKKIYDINKDMAQLKAATAAYAVAYIKAETALTKENLDAETDLTVALLKKKEKDRLEQAAFDKTHLENLKRVSDTEREISVGAARQSGERSVKLAQAQAEPGNEIYVQGKVLQMRIDNARAEAKLSNERIAEERKAAAEALEKTKDRKQYDTDIANLRIAELKTAAQLEKEIADARLDREVAIAEIRRQQAQELRASLSSLYDAMVAKNGGGIKEFLKGYFEQIKKTIFVNIGEILLKGSQQKLGGVIPGQEEIDPATGKGTGKLTTLGKILRGTPLGVDPAKLAADLEIKSRKENTDALDRLTDTIKNAHGDATVWSGGTWDKGGSPSIFGGSVGGGPIFSGFPGSSTTGLAGNGSIFNNPAVFAGFPGLGGGGSGTVGINPNTGQMQQQAAGWGVRNSNGSLNKAGTAAVLVAGGIGVYSGIKQGGASGYLSAASSALGTAAALDPEPISKAALAIGAMAASLVGSILPDPHKVKEELINKTLTEKMYKDPVAINRVQDLAGNDVDGQNYQGGIRGYRGGLTINISALDSKSFNERGPEFADTIHNMIQLGHPLREAISTLPVRS